MAARRFDRPEEAQQGRGRVARIGGLRRWFLGRRDAGEGRRPADATSARVFAAVKAAQQAAISVIAPGVEARVPHEEATKGSSRPASRNTWSI